MSVQPDKDSAFRRPEADAAARDWQKYAEELEGQLTATERRARFVQDQLNHIVNSRGWRVLRGCRDAALAMLRPFPRLRKLMGVLAREGPGGVFRRLREGSIGDARYQDFLRKHALTEAKIQAIRQRLAALPESQRPLISILTPVYNTPPELLLAAVGSVRKQIYERWELILVDDKSPASHVKPLLEKIAGEDPRIRVHFRDKNGNISLATQDALDRASGPFVATLDHDDVLTLDALAETVFCLAAHPNADIVYSDHDMMEMSGQRVTPYFKPDWSPDMFLSNMYLCHLTTFRTELVRKAGGYRAGYEGSQDYDLALRMSELTAPENIRHIPKVLYSWRKVPGSTAHRYSAKSYADQAARRSLQDALTRRGIDGSVESGLIPSQFRVRRAIKGQPLVSILIPFRDHPQMLERCLRSIREKTDYANYEIILIDNGSVLPETARMLEREVRASNVTVLRVDEPFNYSRLNNRAARAAKGEHLLLLNNDTEVLEREWLGAMLEHSQRPEVGGVGARLLYEKNVIQHAGVIMGIGEVAGHAARMTPESDPGYFGSTYMIRNYSAVTAACLMTRKAVFEELGGLNEADLAVAYNDVDYCLRLREKGYLIVYTPYAKLTHHESVSRGFANNPRESAYMCRRWAAALQDPYYNPNLSPSAEDFSMLI
jgi:GT2 family glycosyltransferase